MVPTKAAMVVIMIGRNRTRQASTIASAGWVPWARCLSTAKSIIMMAFFFTIPINMMMPTNEKILSSFLKTNSVIRAPNPAEGNPDKIVNG